jgi:galactose mutarotase-like enzyme
MIYYTIETDTDIIRFTTIGGQIIDWKTKNRLGSWEKILYSSNNLNRSGIPVLFPFADNLDNDLYLYSHKPINRHGFARTTLWHINEIVGNQVTMSFSQSDISEEMQQAYPHEFTCSIVFRILPRKLEYHFIVKNTSDTYELPIAPGLHPYFSLSHYLKQDLFIKNLNFSGSLRNWEAQMHAGEYYNVLEDQTIINFGKHNLTITDHSKSASEKMQKLVFWTQPSTFEDYNFVCFEPFARERNAINSNPILVEPNQVWENILTFEV